MTPRTWTALCLVAGAVWFLGSTYHSQAQQPSPSSPPAQGGRKEKPKPEPTLSLDQARERATVMHDVFESTLHAMHRHYFRNERATVPARALEDVFDDLEDRFQVNARWIAVNTNAMSVDHEAETDFEKQAVKEIGNGKEHIELVEKGVYQRATSIPLGFGCVSCHMGRLAPPPKTPRFAGLVISIPIKSE